MPHFSSIYEAESILNESKKAEIELRRELNKETNLNKKAQIQHEIQFHERQIEHITQEIINMKKNN